MGLAMWCAKLFLILPFSLAKSMLLRASFSTCDRVARVNKGIGFCERAHCRVKIEKVLSKRFTGFLYQDGYVAFCIPSKSCSRASSPETY